MEKYQTEEKLNLQKIHKGTINIKGTKHIKQ